MKLTPLFSSVICALLCTVCTMPADEHSAKELKARQVLLDHYPLMDPSVSLGFVEIDQRKAAEVLFASQVKAMHDLIGSKDASLIPILIPYLHYTEDAAPRESAPRLGEAPLGISAIAARHPAFAVIIGIPTANVALSNYVSDTKNSMSYRIAAFLVLRYINEASFATMSDLLDKELSGSGPATKNLLEAIKNGNSSFDGIHPVDRN